MSNFYFDQFMMQKNSIQAFRAKKTAGKLK